MFNPYFGSLWAHNSEVQCLDTMHFTNGRLCGLISYICSDWRLMKGYNKVLYYLLIFFGRMNQKSKDRSLVLLTN